MKRLTPCLVTVLLASTTSVLGLASPAQAATVKVAPADLGPRGPWFRLQNQPGNAGKPHGVQEVSPLAAPDAFDGSLHLAVLAGEQSQAAHYFPAGKLSDLTTSPLSYDTYVDSSGSTATDTGPSLQLPGYCLGQFTTMSFQPQLATDAQGNHGIVPDTWQHFTSGPDGLWRSSRTVPGTPITEGGDFPLSTYVDSCTGPNSTVLGVIANVGALGDPSATLDTYVDNITAGGDTYDFAVDRRATAALELSRSTGSRNARTIEGTATFTSPATGPYLRRTGTRITLATDRRNPLDPATVELTANGTQVPLTEETSGELTGTAPATQPADLAPGRTATTDLVITIRTERGRPARTGRITVTTELLAQGFTPLQPTGITARATTRG